MIDQKVECQTLLCAREFPIPHTAYKDSKREILKWILDYSQALKSFSILTRLRSYEKIKLFLVSITVQSQISTKS